MLSETNKSVAITSNFPFKKIPQKLFFFLMIFPKTSDKGIHVEHQTIQEKQF